MLAQELTLAAPVTRSRARDSDKHRVNTEKERTKRDFTLFNNVHNSLVHEVLAYELVFLFIT